MTSYLAGQNQETIQLPSGHGYQREERRRKIWPVVFAAIFFLIVTATSCYDSVKAIIFDAPATGNLAKMVAIDNALNESALTSMFATQQQQNIFAGQQTAWVNNVIREQQTKTKAQIDLLEAQSALLVQRDISSAENSIAIIKAEESLVLAKASARRENIISIATILLVATAVIIALALAFTALIKWYKEPVVTKPEIAVHPPQSRGIPENSENSTISPTVSPPPPADKEQLVLPPPARLVPYLDALRAIGMTDEQMKELDNARQWKAADEFPFWAKGAMVELSRRGVNRNILSPIFGCTSDRWGIMSEILAGKQ